MNQQTVCITGLKNSHVRIQMLRVPLHLMQTAAWLTGKTLTQYMDAQDKEYGYMMRQMALALLIFQRLLKITTLLEDGLLQEIQEETENQLKE